MGHLKFNFEYNKGTLRPQTLLYFKLILQK